MESKEDNRNAEALTPVRKFLGRKHGGRDVDDEAAGDDISRGYAINFAALQFREKAAHKNKSPPRNMVLQQILDKKTARAVSLRRMRWVQRRADPVPARS